MTDAEALAGINWHGCAPACSAEGCVITGGPCAHPAKGGLQSALQSRPEVAKRFAAAAKLLGKNEVAA